LFVNDNEFFDSNIDNVVSHRIFRMARENRSYKVGPENRSYKVISEDRVFEVKSESRSNSA